MIRLYCICFFICVTQFAKAQENDYAVIDNKILSIPAAAANSTDGIAAYIQSNFKTGQEKFRAIYRWVTYNIKYDRDSMYIFNWGADPEKKVLAALRRRKGVCENYTAVFNEIAQKCKLSSFVVSGYTKQLHHIDKAGHTWCAVYVNGEWLFCDPTWDERYMYQANYFMIPATLFIESHKPFDPLWQLLDEPVTDEAFYKGLINIKENQPSPQVKENVAAFMKLTELAQLEAAATRIKAAGIYNELQKNNLAFIEMLASLFYEDKDMERYNTAITALNKATFILNEFIEYRNRQFTPARPEEEIKKMLLPADMHLVTAQKNLEELAVSSMNAQYDSTEPAKRLQDLKIKLQQQQAFLNRWFNSSFAERKNIFYE